MKNKEVAIEISCFRYMEGEEKKKGSTGSKRTKKRVEEKQRRLTVLLEALKVGCKST